MLIPLVMFRNGHIAFIGGIMTDKRLELMRHLLREASDMGRRGFYYQDDVEEQELDWQEFEDEAIESIELGLYL